MSGVLIVGKFGDDLTSYSAEGSVLVRAIQRIGARPEMFHYSYAGFDNRVHEAVDKLRPGAILALGDEVLKEMTGLAGDKLTVKHLTGYVLPSSQLGFPPVIPCFHPLFLRLGHINLLGVLMRALRLAIQVAKEQRQPILSPVDNPPAGYITHPTETVALEFLREASSINPEKGYLAYDIETFYSNSEETAEAEENISPNDIRSTQFSFRFGTGIYLPWREPFIPISRALLALQISKLSWNGWRFDDPLLRGNACDIRGTVFDLMWAWHHMQPDIPRGLQFAAAHQGPRIYSPTASWPWPWKHLDKANPPFYGIVDVDVLQWMISYEV